MSTEEKLADLIDRLNGVYRIPITDGLGAVGAGEEPDNPNEFVRKFETSPIKREAASAISRLSAEVQELRAALTIAEERFSQIETAGYSQTRQSATDVLIYAKSLAADGSIRARAALKPETVNG